MTIATPAVVTAARNLAFNPRVAEQVVSFAGNTQGILSKGPTLNLASDAIKGISPIAMA